MGRLGSSQNTPAGQGTCLLAWGFKIGFPVSLEEDEQSLVAALAWVGVGGG